MDMTVITWIVAGLVLILLELFAPGFILVFVGVSALLTGIAIWFGLPGAGAWPWVVFSALTILQIVVLRKYCQKWFRGGTLDGDQAGLDEDFIGRAAEVLSGFQLANSQNHQYVGRVEFRGSQWDAVCGVPLEIGQRVSIAGRDGSRLLVQKA